MKKLLIITAMFYFIAIELLAQATPMTPNLSDSIRILLVGESKGVKVILDVGNPPDQEINFNSYSQKTILLSMNIESKIELHLDATKDVLSFSYKGQRMETNFLFQGMRMGYTAYIPSGYRALYEIQTLPYEKFIDFMLTPSSLKKTLIDSTDKIKAEDEVAKIYQGTFHIASLNLDIPMKAIVEGLP